MNLSLFTSTFLFLISAIQTKVTTTTKSKHYSETMSTEYQEPTKQLEVAFACIGMMGHFKPVVPFIREMHERGHKVTVFVSSSPKYVNELEREGVIKGDTVTIIPVDGLNEIKQAMEEYDGPRNVIGEGGPLALASSSLYPAITSHYEKRRLPDVIVYGFFATAAADAADIMKVPAVTVCPNPLSYDWSPPPGERSIRDKTKAFLVTKLFFESFSSRVFKIMRNKERKLRNLPTLKRQDIFPSTSQIRHVISTTGDGFEFIQKRSPLLNLVGPSAPKTPDPLGNKLEQWINEQEQPIMYIAFGTAYEFNKKTLQKLTAELAPLSNTISILWSLPANQQQSLPSDFILPKSWRLETFVPQWSVLAHPNVKLFITHCGSNSVYESLLNQVPMIACPTGKDQFANGARIEAAGVGMVVNKGATGKVAEAVQTVYKNLSSYDESMKKLKEKFDEQGGEKRAGDIIEMVAEQGYEELGSVTPLKQ
jgi:MGT family glycosyltransferase